jgi:hypothetical protein
MPKQEPTHNLDQLEQARLLRVVAAAIRGAGAARVLAVIDSLAERHVRVDDVIVTLRRMARL